VILVLFVAILLGDVVEDERGAVLGWVAFGVFLGVGLAEVLRWNEFVTWSDEHPAADWALVTVLLLAACVFCNRPFASPEANVHLWPL
jgi:hypothetical protein